MGEAAEAVGTEERGITVLVVDDEDDILMLLKVMLERQGLRVVEQAVDGLEALITVARLAPPPVPTVIVLDNNMPVMSGLEVAQEIFKQIPDQLIVLFSAYLTTEVVARAREIGIAACVSKANLADLTRVISELVASRS